MTVSIPTYWGVLKTFENCARNSRKRVSLRGKILVNDMSNNRLPGPSILLRRASPNTADGATNAAVLNHSVAVRFAGLRIGSAVRFGRTPSENELVLLTASSTLSAVPVCNSAMVPTDQPPTTSSNQLDPTPNFLP